MPKFNWFITPESVGSKSMMTIIPNGAHVAGTPYFYMDAAFFKGMDCNIRLNICDLLDRKNLDIYWRVALPSKEHVEDFHSIVLTVDPEKSITGIFKPMDSYKVNDLSGCLVVDLGKDDLSWLKAFTELVEAEFPTPAPEILTDSQEELLADMPTAISNIWVASIRLVPFYGLVLHLSNLTADIMLNQDLYKEIESYADAKGGLLVINHTEVNNRMMRHVIRKAADDGLLVVEAANQADLDGFVKSVIPLLTDDSVYEKCFKGLGQRQSIEESLEQDTSKLVASNNRYFLSRIVEGLDK